jgi:7,8-dihydropterin-6-yl-methyl-4-(beta-D-ribofuranosyl)aminobenzene 5'-phosphate synthase
MALDLIYKANGGRAIPCYLHPGMFRQRALPLPGGGLLPIHEIPSPDELAAKGAAPVVTTDPQILLDDMFQVSGEIPRITGYERGFPGHKRRSEDGQSWEDDPLIMDERFLAAHVRGKGIVVFTACSHAGVVNVLKHARSSFPAVPLYAVAGGFHLAGGNERIIAEIGARHWHIWFDNDRSGPLYGLARCQCPCQRIWRERCGALSGRKNICPLEIDFRFCEGFRMPAA